MRRKRKISRKVSRLLLSAMFLTVLLYSIAGVWGLNTIKQISLDSNKALGKTAAEDAKSALENLAGNHLQNIAVEKAAYIEEKFLEVSSYVHGIAAMSESIYENPSGYPDREVPSPQPGCRELTVQLLRAERMKDVAADQNQELLKLANIQDLLVQYNANNHMVSSAYVTTVSGWLIQADYIAYSKFSGQKTEPDFYEADTRQWVQRALEASKGEIVYSDVITDVHGGGDCLVCAQPIFHNGKVVAVAGVGSYLETVNNTVLKTTIGENGYAFLVNQNGQVMTSPMKEGETAVNGEKSAALSKLAEKMVAGESGLEKLKIDGREVYLAYAPLKELGWSFAAVIDVEEIIAPANESQDMILRLANSVEVRQEAAIGRMLISLFLITVGVAALISIFGAIFTRKLTEPIRKLTSDVEMIGRGNLDHEIHLKTGDEIEDLGKTFNLMTGQIRSHIKNISEITAEKERIRTELTVASKLQADMLPESLGSFPDRTDFSLWAQMTPAREVGGDFYDFFMADEDHLVFLVADVSGKGVPAALFMVVAKTLIRSRMKGDFEPAQAFTDTNDSLYENNKNEMFVTAWLGVLTLSTGNLIYVNAGHNPPLLKTGEGFSYLNQRTGFVLAGMEGLTYGQSQLQLMPGDGLFLYTDGVTEAHDTGNQLYGEIRLKEKLEEYRDFTPKEQVGAIWRDIQEFKGSAEQFDDITMLALCYKGDGYHKNTGSADISRMEEIEDFIEEILEEGEVPRNPFIKMQIAVDEIISNICRYSKAEEVTIACRVANGKIRLFFEDNGIPFNPLKRPDPDITDELERRKIGGYGIYIVKQSMDGVTYEYVNGKNRLFLMKNV